MERKQLLGAVLDEVQHQMTLFKPERAAYFALAFVAATCLIAATGLLFMHAASPELVIGVIGGAGLVAAAAGRTGWFFHSTFKLLDDLVRRFSKVTDADFESALGDLKRTSHVSLILIVIGGLFVIGGVVFTFARVRPLETEFGQKVLDVVKLETDVLMRKRSEQKARKDYEALKNSIEKTYGLHVMPDQGLLELKASAEPLPRKKNAPAEYKYSVFLRASGEVLGGVKQVRYDLRDPAMSAQPLAADQSANGFLASYSGATCEPSVGIAIELKSGAKDAFDADLCRAVGQQPTAMAAARPEAEAPAEAKK